MARTVAFQVNGTTWNMPANYGVSKELAESGYDPLEVVRAAAAGKLAWNQEDVISVLHIGVKHAGSSIEREKVGDAVVEFGLLQSLRVASKLIETITNSGPESPIKGGASKKSRAGLM